MPVYGEGCCRACSECCALQLHQTGGPSCLKAWPWTSVLGAMHFTVEKFGRFMGAMGTCFGTLIASSIAAAQEPAAASGNVTDEASHVGGPQTVQAGPRLGGHIGT